MLPINEKIETLVASLNLSPHPEGGYYREYYRCAETNSFDERFNQQQRSVSTGIYFLIKTAAFSAWHRIKSDEAWHFYEGSPVTILTINPASKALQRLKLGRTSEHPGTEYTVIIPKEHWFCAYVEEPDSFALCGCTVAPGFDFQDFELADKAALQAEFPEHEEVIARFTR